MPRGCVIALIIVGALALLLVIFIGLICANRDKVLRWSTREGVNYYKTQLSTKPIEGIDTVQFDRLADSFLVRVQTANMADTAGLRFAGVVQNSLLDKKIDREDVYRLSDAMVALFPDLAPMALHESPGGSTAPAETTAVPADTG